MPEVLESVGSPGVNGVAVERGVMSGSVWLAVDAYGNGCAYGLSADEAKKIAKALSKAARQVERDE